MTTPSPTESGDVRSRARAKTGKRNGAVQRQRLKDAAVKLFASKGFHATTVRQIAARVSLQPGILYHYFASKQDLLREICVDFAMRAQAKVETILETVDEPVEAVAALLRAGIENALTYPDASSVLRTETRALRRHQRTLVADAVRLHRQNWMKLIERGVQERFFDCPDPRLAAMVITQIEDVSSWYSPTGRLSKDQIIDELTNFALKVLGHRCTERCASQICRRLSATGVARSAVS